jgi:leucyl-tRNA synthetase
MNTLYKMGGRIEKAKRFAVYSPLDGQPCADHDRASGEGVGPQEYVLIKMKVTQPTGRLAELDAVREGKCFLAAATLRAETMYGQTNFWVLPDGDYGAYQMTDGEVFVLSARAARNLAFQDKTPQFGQAQCLLELKGSELLGCGVAAPLAFNEVIYGLPMLTILMTKGTGIVTSVPSDAPDDYMALQDLKKKPAMREKFGIKDEWVMPFEVIPIINIPEFGDTSAVTVCEELKIQSQNDRVKLDEAKNRTYLKGFYEGVMLVGDFKGMPVQEAKPLLKDKLVADGRACLYSEPEKKVMSRSGEECVVALTDQWYLSYGEEEWLALARECIGTMNLYGEENAKQFDLTLGWLKQWALSRSFGLGTRLPWDPEFLVESLSDSTIYMAYYTIAHLLQEGDMFGYGQHSTPASALTDAVFDHVFLDKPLPADCAVDSETVKKMKREFEFWYPFDLRVSGKDLIQNHLTFTVYNHAAIFPRKHWPRAFRCNGHLMLNSEKMSKSTGNFKTLRQAIDEYSADAMRLALADAGDGLEDANFVEATSNASILRLTKEIDWIESMLASELRADSELFADRVFAAEVEMAVALTVGHYNALNFREALKSGWFDLQTARDTYRLTCGAAGMRKDLVLRFIEVQALLLGPICPHTCEHIWGNLLQRDSLLVRTPLPTVAMTAEHQNTVMAGRYLQDTVTSLRKLVQKLETPRKAKGGKAAEAPPKVTGVSLFVKDSFTGWHQTALAVLSKLFDAAKKSFPDDTHAQVLAALAEDSEAAASVQVSRHPIRRWLVDVCGPIGCRLHQRTPVDCAVYVR